MQISSFKPVVAPDARVLILGTMPGVKSLELHQYYGHPRNAFWPLISAVLGVPTPATYEARLQLVLQNRLALWDVLAECWRKGSLDSAIEQPVPADIGGLLAVHPGIEHIVLNGGYALKWYKQYIKDTFGRQLHLMPSTSPAHARLGFEQKLEQWQALRHWL